MKKLVTFTFPCGKKNQNRQSIVLSDSPCIMTPSKMGETKNLIFYSLSTMQPYFTTIRCNIANSTVFHDLYITEAYLFCDCQCVCKSRKQILKKKTVFRCEERWMLSVYIQFWKQESVLKVSGTIEYEYCVHRYNIMFQWIWRIVH